MGASGGGVHAEPDGLLNDTWSRGTADLRDRVHVRGILHAQTRTVGSNVVIDGSDTTPPFDPPSTLSWTVTYPAGTGPDLILNPDEVKSGTPGLYGSMTVNSRATLTLAAGTYYLTNLDVEPQATIRLDQAKGPVVIYVANGLILRGSFLSVSGDAPDLLIAYLGQTTVVAESLFNGAILAPFTTVTLRAVTGVHTGFFASKDFQVLDAHVQVQYRTPLAILTASHPNKCVQLLTTALPPAAVQAATKRYCGECPRFEDTDRDGVQNCLDQCPYDPLKTAPGVCLCGVPDTDSDGDGVPDCLDQCPNDPNNTSPGMCGCLGSPNLKPAGTPCFDPPGPQTGATCNGSGVCGSRPTSNPGGNACKLVTLQEVSYWFCGILPTGGADGGPPAGRTTQGGAQAACSAKGLTLARIDSGSLNRFITRLSSTGPIWLGANDISTAGVWRWSAPNTNNGDQFWSGGATGSAVGNRFSNWALGAPGTQTCALLQPDGYWIDANCNQTAGYICEFHIPSTPPDGGAVGSNPPGFVGTPPPRGACISEQEAGLTTDAEVLKQQIALVKADVFVGAAANPPPSGSKCPDNPDANALGRRSGFNEGCSFVNVQALSKDCMQDTDCSQYGTGFLCRQVPDDPNCNPPVGDAAPGGPVDGATCRGHSFCGQLSCPTDNLPCNQVELCGPYPDIDAGPDPGSNLDAEPVNPAALFNGAPVPDAAPSPGYSDPAIRGDIGRNHSWCFMNPQNASSSNTSGAISNSVLPGQQQAKNKGGTSGSGKVISFDFDPDLTFDVQANPLAMGETNLGIHAQAKFIASVSLNKFLDQSYRTNIVDAVAGIALQRCTLTDKETHFRVLGLDVIDPADLPLFDTSDPGSPLFNFTTRCNDAVKKFQYWANRAKKAFRDGQQLVQQFKNVNGLLSGDLCQQIGLLAADVPGFPGGNLCPPNEPVAITINRFLEYYQGSGGQLSQLEQAAMELASISNLISQKLHDPNLIKVDFGGKPHEESQTVVSIPFAIGPVPMLLQIDAFEQYGINGRFNLDVFFGSLLNLSGGADENPDQPNNPKPTPKPLAKVTAAVLPHASAGISAFVGAGADLGPFSATVGIEGAVSLADVQAPIYAGAGLDIIVTKDLRPLPQDIAPPVSLITNNFQFGIPKAFKFVLEYDYGAGVDLTKVLNGEINGKLRIKFAFFSRTWRKRIVKFNGWKFHFNLLSGGNSPDIHPFEPPAPVTTPAGTSAEDPSRATTPTFEGNTQMGRSEDQVPLTVLSYLPIPGGDIVPGGVVTNSGDDPGSSNGNEAVSLAAPGDDAGTVAFDAGAVQGFFYDDLCCIKPPDQGACSISGTPHCCPGFKCQADPGSPPDQGHCVVRCKIDGEKCATNGDCCQPIPGDPDAIPRVCGVFNTCLICGQTGAQCKSGSQCCSGVCDPTQHLCVAQCPGVGQTCSGGPGSCCAGLQCGSDTHTCFQPCAGTNGSCMTTSDCCQDINRFCDPMAHICKENIVP
jgi:hypothetical protein